MLLWSTRLSPMDIPHSARKDARFFMEESSEFSRRVVRLAVGSEVDEVLAECAAVVKERGQLCKAVVVVVHRRRVHHDVVDIAVDLSHLLEVDCLDIVAVLAEQRRKRTAVGLAEALGKRNAHRIGVGDVHYRGK